ncbi:MAG: DMT family transporter [Kiritimatiellia bacterium]
MRLFPQSVLGPFLLLVTTIFWGGGFVAQKLGAGHLGPNAVIVLRSIVAVLFLLGVQLVRRKNGFSRATFLRGAICGVALFIPMLAQQKAFDHPITPGVCAFLTANYMLLVPVIGLFAGRKAALSEWIALVPALAGTYLICVTGEDSFKVGAGEIWTLISATFFAVEILVVDRFAPTVDAIALSAVMFGTCAVCGVPCLLVGGETARLSGETIRLALGAILFLGVGSSGIGYTLQNVAQGLRTPPALAAIVMSLESVFGALFGWMFFGDLMTPRCLIGCVLVFGAALGVELAHVCLRKDA